LLVILTLEGRGGEGPPAPPMATAIIVCITCVFLDKIYDADRPTGGR